MVGGYATLWAPSLLPQFKDPWTKRPYSRGRETALLYLETKMIYIPPFPQNTSFGYFVGGWGKPPVDEIGRPLYGDVFGLEKQDVGQRVPVEEEVDKTVWGELESEEEEEEEEDEVMGVAIDRYMSHVTYPHTGV